jgi:hypothetical protein
MARHPSATAFSSGVVARGRNHPNLLVLSFSLEMIRPRRIGNTKGLRVFGYFLVTTSRIMHRVGTGGKDRLAIWEAVGSPRGFLR